MREFPELEYAGCKISETGSRFTCTPAKTTTDEDYLVEVPDDQIRDVEKWLQSTGWTREGATSYSNNDSETEFVSYRKGMLNLIVTADPWFAELHRTATALCRRLNLQSKQDRIAVFKAVLYGDVHSTYDLE